MRRSRFVALIGVSDPTVMAIKSGNWLLRRTTKSLLILACVGMGSSLKIAHRGLKARPREDREILFGKIFKKPLGLTIGLASSGFLGSTHPYLHAARSKPSEEK